MNEDFGHALVAFQGVVSRSRYQKSLPREVLAQSGFHSLRRTRLLARSIPVFAISNWSRIESLTILQSRFRFFREVLEGSRFG